MSEAFVLHDPDGYRCYHHIGATHKQRIGPAWKTPREAIEYAKALDAASEVSPLPTPRRADEPDLAGGFWGAAESRDADRQPAGSPVAHSPLPGAG